MAAKACNERVAGGGLGNVVSTLIKPSLEIRVGPRSVEPVTGVVDSLLCRLGSGLVVLTNSLQERVALAGLRNWDTVLVGESLELGV